MNIYEKAAVLRKELRMIGGCPTCKHKYINVDEHPCKFCMWIGNGRANGYIEEF